MVRTSEVRGMLVKFADLPSRFNAWVPLNAGSFLFTRETCTPALIKMAAAGRLAPIGTFTAGFDSLPPVRGSFMVNGTTAEIPGGVGAKVNPVPTK